MNLSSIAQRCWKNKFRFVPVSHLNSSRNTMKLICSEQGYSKLISDTYILPHALK